MKLGVIALVVTLVMALGVIALTEQSTTATVTVNTFLSVTLSNAPVTFPSMDPLATKNASVGNGFPLTATIGNESNVNANVETKADGANFCIDYPTCAGNKFGVGNMTWDNATIGPWTSYTISNVQVCGSVGAGSACNIYHQLTIPSGQAAGAYSAGITITATSVV